uniref:Uncharacterized protein n=1 Tax=Nelumbo nucifera TaxID=4432 RepID=A0A822YNN3_NELNU|nr:TPA_asm: hypothetical protein HUJ06_012032 [Nelumbo nucifera]
MGMGMGMHETGHATLEAELMHERGEAFNRTSASRNPPFSFLLPPSSFLLPSPFQPYFFLLSIIIPNPK